MRCPCVVTSVGDSASIVGQCGIVVPPRNPEALAAGLISCETDRCEVEQPTRMRIVEKFSVEKMARLTGESNRCSLALFVQASLVGSPATFHIND